MTDAVYAEARRRSLNNNIKYLKGEVAKLVSLAVSDLDPLAGDYHERICGLAVELERADDLLDAVKCVVDCLHLPDGEVSR